VHGRMGTFNVQPFDGARIRRSSIRGTAMCTARPSASIEEDGERMNEPTERQREAPHSETPVERAV